MALSASTIDRNAATRMRFSGVSYARAVVVQT